MPAIVQDRLMDAIRIAEQLEQKLPENIDTIKQSVDESRIIMQEMLMSTSPDMT